MELFDLMKKLSASFGVSGSETETADLLAQLAAPYVDEIQRDVMGNLFCHKKGSGPKMMLAAHMDSIGFIVTHIEEKGYLRVGMVGGVTPSRIRDTHIRFQNGTRGVVVVDQSADQKAPTISDLVIDIGAASREEAEAMVQVGDTAVYDAPVVSLGKQRMAGPYMDDRICCAVLLLAMERLQKTDNDLWFVFTVQEEVGLRGAKTAAWTVDPDYALAADVTIAGDEAGSKHNGSCTLGGGAAIKVMDGHVIAHPEMVKTLERLAKEQDITYQMDVIRAGGTDAGEIHKTRFGVVTGGVSVPCRYTHTPAETVDCADVEACANLIAAFCSATFQ